MIETIQFVLVIMSPLAMLVTGLLFAALAAGWRRGR